MEQLKDEFPSRQPPMRGRYTSRSPLAAFILHLLDLALLPIGWFRKTPGSKAPRKILIANATHLGDLVLSVPTLAWLRQAYPDAQLHLLIGSWSAAVAEDLTPSLVDKTYCVDHFLRNRGPGPRIGKVLRYLKMSVHFVIAARAERYDLAIDLGYYFPSMAPLLWASGAKERVGFESAGFAPLFSATAPFVHTDRPISDYPRDLLRSAKCLSNTSPPARLSPAYPSQRQAFPSDRIDASRPYILLHPSAGHSSKHWDDAKWGEVARRLSERFDIVVCGAGPEEERRCATIAEACGGRGVNLAGRLSWTEFAAAVEGAACVVCLDSVAQHLAAAFARPVAVVFSGFNNPTQWGPDSKAAIVLRYPTPCLDCNRRSCSVRTCILGVTPAEVVSAVHELLK